MNNPEQAKPYSVHELTSMIDHKLTEDGTLQNIAVTGELIDYKRHPSSGHAYFTMTDKESPASKKAILKCTFFKFQNRSLNFTPRAGMEVIAIGGVSLYYQGGQYNFNVKQLVEVGMGKLLVQIQELKKKLIEEGLIDPAKRRPLPQIPKRLGIVTGISTAAFQDMLKQVNDRYPHVEVLVAPAMVQGEEAPDSICRALAEISKEKWKCDVIIVGRGGGSAEDLMAFNDEKLCRAIAACPVPIISAVGHQIDHPISDDVADVAAATPTDAAKIALPVISEKLESLELLQRHLNRILENRFSLFQEKLRRINQTPFFKNPYVLIEGYYQQLDEKENRMREAFRNRFEGLSRRFRELPAIEPLAEKVLIDRKNRLDRTTERLFAFSPLSTLKRGYSVVYQDDKIMRELSGIDPQKEISVRMHGGRLRATPVEKIEDF